MTFTPEQLNSMTLDELERYYNSDPNDLNLCHAYIAEMSLQLEETKAALTDSRAESATWRRRYIDA